MAEAAHATSDASVTRDTLLGGAVTLLQPRRGHRAGTDAVLLAGLADAQEGDHVLDLGSASGAVGLMVAYRVPGARITFVEREPALVPLCRENIALNGFSARASAVEADVFASRVERDAAGLVRGAADLVVTNPPYGDDPERASPDAGRHAAHVMRGGDLEAWLACAADLLRHRGRLCLIHRADQLDLCLRSLSRGFGSPVVVPIYAREGEAATRIVVRAVKGGRAPLVIAAGLVLHSREGGFTPEVAALHGGPAR